MTRWGVVAQRGDEGGCLPVSVRHPADQTRAHHCHTSSLKASATGNHAKQPISTEFFNSLSQKRTSANHQFGRLEPSIWFKSLVSVTLPRLAARPSRNASTAPVLLPRAALSRAIIAQASTHCGSSVPLRRRHARQRAGSGSFQPPSSQFRISQTLPFDLDHFFHGRSGFRYRPVQWDRRRSNKTRRRPLIQIIAPPVAER